MPCSALPDGALAAFTAGCCFSTARTPGTPPSCRAEALERLRALTHGFRIKTGVVDNPPPCGVDTEDDLRMGAGLLAGQGPTRGV